MYSSLYNHSSLQGQAEQQAGAKKLDDQSLKSSDEVASESITAACLHLMMPTPSRTSTSGTPLKRLQWQPEGILLSMQCTGIHKEHLQPNEDFTEDI